MEYLRQGLELLRQQGAASAFSVTTFPAPIFRALRLDDHGRLDWQWSEYAETRSQDLPQVFHDAGQFYWVDVPRFKERPDTLNDAVPVYLPRWGVQDIDTPDDWRMAELLYATLQLLNPE